MLRYLTILLILTFYSQAVQAQYYSDKGIYVLNQEEAAHSLTYRTIIDLPEDFNPEHIDSTIGKLAYEIHNHNANVVKIIHRTITNTLYNKTFSQKLDENKFGIYQAELFYTNEPEKVQPVSIYTYLDSLQNDLITDTSKEALIVYFSSPYLQDVDPYPYATFRFKDVKPCKMGKYSICSYIVTEETPISFNIGKKNQFSINVKFGKVYFIEYFPTPLGEVRPADFLWAYRTCRELQKINLQRKQMKEPEEY